MVLAKSEILKKIKNKEIEIKPFKTRNVGAGSIDLTLSNEFRHFTAKKEKIKITEKIDFSDYTKKFKAQEVILRPRDMVLGITKERIKLPENICGFLQGRSRFARMGLSVHVTAAFVQPGTNNRQVLEIINLGPKDLKLIEGTKIVQLILEKTEGHAKHKGRYKNQESL